MPHQLSHIFKLFHHSAFLSEKSGKYEEWHVLKKRRNKNIQLIHYSLRKLPAIHFHYNFGPTCVLARQSVMVMCNKKYEKWVGQLRLDKKSKVLFTHKISSYCCSENICSDFLWWGLILRQMRLSWRLFSYIFYKW